jgi:hypothetical protein
MTSTTGPRASRADAAGDAAYDPGDGYSMPAPQTFNAHPTDASSWSDDASAAHRSSHAGPGPANSRFAATASSSHPPATGFPPPPVPAFAAGPTPFAADGDMPPFATGGPAVVPPQGSEPFGGRPATFAPSDVTSAAASAPLYLSDPEDAAYGRRRRRRRSSAAAGAERGGYDGERDDGGRDRGRDDGGSVWRSGGRDRDRDRDLDLDRGGGGTVRRRSYAYGNDDDASSADEWNSDASVDGDRHRRRDDRRHRDRDRDATTRRSKSGDGALQKRRRSLSRGAARLSAFLTGRGGRRDDASDDDRDRRRASSARGVDGEEGGGGGGGNSELKKMAATLAGALVGGLAARRYRRDGGWVPAAIGAVAGGLAAREGEKLYYTRRGKSGKGEYEEGYGGRRREVEPPFEAAEGRGRSGERSRSRGR